MPYWALLGSLSSGIQIDLPVYWRALQVSVTHVFVEGHSILAKSHFSLFFPQHILVLRWSEDGLDLARGCRANVVLMGHVRSLLLLFLPEAARKGLGEEKVGLVYSHICPLPHASSTEEGILTWSLMTPRHMVRQPSPTSVLWQL